MKWLDTLLISVALSKSVVSIDPHDVLEQFKEEYRIKNSVQYDYQVPSEAEIKRDTFFHDYFPYYKTASPKMKNENNSGYMLEIPDSESIFLDYEDIDLYGKIDFKFPYGPLKLDHSIVNKTVNEHIDELNNLIEIENNSEAARILADINLFGLYNTPVDVKQAEALYLRIVNELPNVSAEIEGHAHFMLGVIYSTGVFGNFEKDPAKGLIHYRFAADLNNIQAQMTLAHKYMFAVNVVENYSEAIYYFSLIKERIEGKIGSSMLNVQKTPSTIVEEMIFSYNLNKFDVSWCDFEDGIFGPATQALDTLRYFETFDDYEKIKQMGTGSLGDDDYVADEDETLNAYSLLYFETQKHYNGDYLNARNYDMAFKFANLCVSNGLLEPDVAQSLKNVEKLNQAKEEFKDSSSGFKFEISFGEDLSPLDLFVGRCAQYLGHMYLRGEGTEVNYDLAKHYIDIGKNLAGNKPFLSDNGIINYYGLGMEADKKKALEIYEDGIKYASPRYYKALHLIDEFETQLKTENPDIIPEKIITMLSTASPYNMLAKRKLIQLYEEGRYTTEEKSISGVYNSYVKLLDHLYFDFKLPFYSFINSKPENDDNKIWTGLVSLAIASEIGYANAQQSLGVILWPTLGKFASKKYRYSDDIYSTVFTAQRFKEAISYLEISAKHYNRDSINYLGDLYYNGLYPSYTEQIQTDPLYNRPWWQYVLPLSSVEEEEKSWLLPKLISLFETIDKIISPLKLTLRSIGLLRNSSTYTNEIAIVPRDVKKAISYYYDASTLGSHLGSYNVGWAYEFGIGVAQDLNLAKRYYELSLERSNLGYLAVKFAILRLELKAYVWSLIGCDGRGIREINHDGKTWKERFTMIISMFGNPNFD